MATYSGSGDDPAHTTPDTEQAAPSVLCPQGHANAWNYKFCGQCGTPIGVVAWPAEESEQVSERPTRSRVPFAVGAAAVLVVVLVAVAVGIYLVNRTSVNDQPLNPDAPQAPAAMSPANAGPAPCPQAPLMETESIDLTSDGLEVRAAFVSPCGVDIESNSALVVTVAEGRRDVASAKFDFSKDPLAIDRGVPARRTLVFPAGMYWRTPNMLTEAPALVATRDGRAGKAAQAAASRQSSTTIASEGAKPAYGSVDGVAEAVLEELRDADLVDVRRNLVHGWVPQISSKKVGLVAAGKTWSNAEILREHLGLRQRFAGTRLVWSGHWTVFSDPNFWVTVVGPAHYYPDEANRWCDANDFGIDDCFAKFISSVFGVPGTTVYRK
jgi:hypothetical protein